MRSHTLLFDNSRGSREATSFPHIFTPAPGLNSISGRPILCNPNRLTHPSILPISLSSVYSPTRYIMSTKIITSRERRETQFSLPSLLSAPNLKCSFYSFSSNLNRRLALLFPFFLPVLSWLQGSFFANGSISKGLTDKGKPFERVGRKTTDLFNGGWVTEVKSHFAHSFVAKSGLFLFSPSLQPRRPTMNIARSLIIKHTDLESSYIPLLHRREVLARDKNRCHFCHEPTTFLCHDLVKCRGGKTTSSNLLTCCVTCRREKGEFTAAEYSQVRLKEENIFEEVIMRIKVYFTSGRDLTGEVTSEPSFTAPEFYIKTGDNGNSTKINTRNVDYFDILGGKEKGDKEGG